MINATSLSLAIAAAVGCLSGAHTAIWGMYKDAPHEGFTATRFLRSVVIGAAAAIVVQLAFGLPIPDPAAMVILFGLAYATERGIVEVWKTFVREEDQSKYFIPMQFSIRGVPVASRGVRIALGAAYVTAIGGCLWLISRMDQTPATPWSFRAALAGLAVGAIIAVGGGWKDAPKEGFDLLKFFRSPAMTVFFALILSTMTDSHLQIAVASIGYERAAAETYKTFFFPSKPRGKFSGKPILYPVMLERRRYFVPVYVAISFSAIVCVVMAVSL